MFKDFNDGLKKAQELRALIDHDRGLYLKNTRELRFLEQIACMYEAMCGDLIIAKEHFSSGGNADIVALAAKDAADYRFKAIEEAKRLHNEGLNDNLRNYEERPWTRENL